MRTTRLFSVIAVSLMLFVPACEPKATPTQSVATEPPVTDLPASETPASNAIQIIEMEPPLENGLSANDPVMVRVQYSLLENEGKLQVWFERFLDAQCTQLGSGGGPKGGSTLPGGTIVTIEGGSQEYEFSLPPIPPVDTAYVGVGVRLWTADEMTALAEDVSYTWCYEARLASVILPTPVSSAEIGSGPGLGNGSISGTVFVDSNGNSRQDSGDEVKPNLSLALATGDCRTSMLSTTSAADGTFSFTNQVAGIYCVILDFSGPGVVRPGTSIVVRVTAGGNTRADYMIQPNGTSQGATGSISGSVSVGGAPALQEIQLEVWDSSDHLVISITVVGGEYRIPDILPGEYSIRAIDPVSRMSANVSGISVLAGTNTPVPIMDIPAGSPASRVGSISGTVTLNGIPAHQVLVRLEYQGALIGSTFTHLGSFDIQDIPPGTYTLTATDDRGSMASTTIAGVIVQAMSMTTVSVNIQAESAPPPPEAGLGSISGSVTYGGVPTAGITVQLLDRYNTIQQATTTDDSGAYTFQDVSTSATYDVVISMSSPCSRSTRVNLVRLNPGETTTLSSVDLEICD